MGRCGVCKLLGYASSLALLVLASCDGGKDSHGVLPGLTEVAAQRNETALHRTISVEEAVAEVQAAELPAGVDAGLWSMLTAELASVLEERLTTEGALAATKMTSTPPSGEINRVTDLSYVAGGGVRLEWTYVNLGDYDQNSEVSISDLTPIGQYFGATSFDANWSDAQLADGDGNGEVNIADITPIGQNFFSTVLAYNVYASFDPSDYPQSNSSANGPGTQLVGSADFSSASGTGSQRKKFSFTVASPQAGESYWVRPTDGQQNGSPSNLVSGVQAPVVTGVLPNDGIEGAEVVFGATHTGTLPIALVWNFGGGAEPNESSGALPTVTLGAVGEYEASVTATNAYGVDTFPFTLTVIANAAPTAQLGALPLDGDAPLAVEFDAGGSSDTDGTVDNYEFDFDEGDGWVSFGAIAQAQHTYSAGGTYDPAVRVTDNLGATDTATVQITVVNSPPVAVLNADPSQGNAPMVVNFDASDSSDPNGLIVDYEWDLDGDGTFNEAGDESDARGGMTVNYTYEVEGTYNPALRVTDDEDATDTASVEVTVAACAGWQHTWGTALDDSGGAIGVDLSGNVYAVGSNTAPIFLKYDVDGALLWAKTLDSERTIAQFSAAIDGSGNIYFASEATGLPPGIVLLKIDAAGNLLWQKTWNVADDIVDEQIDVGIDASGNVYVSALSFGIGGGGYDLILFKTDTGGSMDWQIYINHGEINKDGFAVDAAGNSYITGAEGRLLKIDTDGAVLWQKRWETDTHDHPYALVVDSSGNIYWTGASDGLGEPYRPFLLKLSSSGDLLWQVSYDGGAGGGAPDLIDIVLDGLGNLYALVPEDEGVGAVGPQMYRCDTDGAGTGHWEYNHAGAASASFALAVDGDGYVYLAGKSVDNTGTWEAGSGTEGVFTGVLNDVTVNTVAGGGLMTDIPGGLTTASGTEDTGGGGDDILVIKILADALPTA